MKAYFTAQRAFGAASDASGPGDLLGAAESLDGLACFETMRAYRGRIFQLDQHLARLDQSCRGIARRSPWPAGETADWLRSVLARSGHADAVLRFSVHWQGQERGTGVCLVRPFAGHPQAWYEDGVEVVSVVPKRPAPRAQEPQIKASQFVSGVLASIDHSERKVHEFVFLGCGGTVAEGSVSNLFAVKGKSILTPSAASGILRGITRDLVIALAREAGWPVAETLLTRHDFYTADECFMTNTSSEVLPVVRMDGRSIGAGAPGPVTRVLAEKFKQFVEGTLR